MKENKKNYIKPEAKDLCLVIREAIANDDAGITWDDINKDITSSSDPIEGGDF